MSLYLTQEPKDDLIVGERYTTLEQYGGMDTIYSEYFRSPLHCSQYQCVDSQNAMFEIFKKCSGFGYIDVGFGSNCDPVSSQPVGTIVHIEPRALKRLYFLPDPKIVLLRNKYREIKQRYKTILDAMLPTPHFFNFICGITADKAMKSDSYKNILAKREAEIEIIKKEMEVLLRNGGHSVHTFRWI